MPDDLKNFRPDSFQIVTDEIAGYLLLAGVVLAVVLEKAGML